MISRRRVIFALGAGALAAPLASFAQQTQAKIARIGFLSAASDSGFGAKAVEALRAGLRDLGYMEGRNIFIETRWAEGKYERLPELARELVRLKVDVIVAVPSPAIRAAQQATSTIPIVFATTGDPVGSGFAASLARPGGNITGLSNSNLDVSAKLLDLLKAIAPKLTRVAMLGNPGSSTQPAHLKSTQAAARTVGIQILAVEARSPEEIERGFARMTREGAGAVIIAADSLFLAQSRRIAELALNHRLPSISQHPFYAEAGGLMSYGQNTLEGYRRAASYVDKILKGAKPGDLPIEQPTRFQLLINRKTAKALGLTIPPELLLSADEVIE